MPIKEESPLLANPDIVFREEEEGSFLFNPDTAELKCLNLMGSIIWKLLDGFHSQQEIVSIIRDHYSETSHETIRQQVDAFLQELMDMGYAGYPVVRQNR